MNSLDTPITTPSTLAAIPELADRWLPQIPATTTFAWVSSTRYDGKVVLQDAPDATKRLAQVAVSCPDTLIRGDLVLVSTDGHHHYVLALLHRRPVQRLQLCDPRFGRAANG